MRTCQPIEINQSPFRDKAERDTYRPAMHPPAFRASHHLSDWPECRLELTCCRGQVVIPVRLLMRQHGDPTFATILARLRCRRCKGAPAPVFLCAGGREHTGGVPPDWAIELVPRHR
jgi:hypothetical protein